MTLPAHTFDPKDRFAAKERVRKNDVLAMRSGLKSPAQVRAESGSFAFAEGRATINLKAAQNLI